MKKSHQNQSRSARKNLGTWRCPFTTDVFPQCQRPCIEGKIVYTSDGVMVNYSAISYGDYNTETDTCTYPDPPPPVFIAEPNACTAFDFNIPGFKRTDLSDSKKCAYDGSVTTVAESCKFPLDLNSAETQDAKGLVSWASRCNIKISSTKPTGPGGSRCTDPFHLDPVCECYPGNSLYDAALCPLFLAEACKTDPQGPGCPDCADPSTSETCLCNPCNTLKFDKILCKAVADRNQLDFVDVCVKPGEEPVFDEPNVQASRSNDLIDEPALEEEPSSSSSSSEETDVPEPSYFEKNKGWIIFLIVFAIVALGVGLGIFFYKRSNRAEVYLPYREESYPAQNRIDYHDQIPVSQPGPSDTEGFQ